MSVNHNRPSAENREGGFLNAKINATAEFIISSLRLPLHVAMNLTSIPELLVKFDDATMHPLDKDV